MAYNNTITTALVGTEIAFGDKFSGIIPASNGKIYLVPFIANKVISFDPQANEWNEIGDDLGERRYKWYGRSLGDDGKIYCNPFQSNDILVIDPSTETTTFIQLPRELHGPIKYCSSSPDQNGNILFFNNCAIKIFKLNTATNIISTLYNSRVERWHHATLSSNGHIYVTPCDNPHDNYIMDFNPIDESISEINHSSINIDNRYSRLVEHQDGHLYGISQRGILIINVTTNEVKFVDHQLGKGDWTRWGDSIIGRDGCMYTLCISNSQILRHDPINKTTTNTYQTGHNGNWGWSGLSLGCDGNGYCAPHKAAQILKICISPGHWLYLKHRLLFHERRATTHEQDHEGLEIVRQFIINANDDEFSYVMEFM